MRVTVYGMGYVGVVTAAHLSSLGHEVFCVEVNKTKVNTLRRGEVPFYEPDLEKAWQKALENGAKVVDSHDKLPPFDISIVCVGTPLDKVTEELDVSIVHKVAKEIFIRVKEEPHLLIIRSTMVPKETRKIANQFTARPKVEVVFMPEFLREGSAMKDVKSDTIFVGCADTGTRKQIYNNNFTPLWHVASLQVFHGTYEEIEMLKLVNNAWHATKIVFTNEVSRICDHVGANSRIVMNYLCKDTKLNISPAYMKPGFAYGGSCLPKDVAQIENLGIDAYLMEELTESNRMHIRFTLNKIIKLADMFDYDTVSIVGVAFKADTDDLRNSAVVTLIKRLIGRTSTGPRQIQNIQLEDKFVNRNVLKGILDGCTNTGMVKWVDYPSDVRNTLVVVTQWHTQYTPHMMECNKGTVVLDLFNIPHYIRDQIRAQGAEYVGLTW